MRMSAGLSVGQKLSDHLCRRRGALFVVLGNDGEALFAAELKRNVAPGRAAQRRPVFAAASGERVEFGADEDGRGCTGYGFTPALSRRARTPFQFDAVGPDFGEVIEEGQRVRLAAAELGGEIEDGRGLDLDAREPPDHAAAKLAQA